MKQQSLLHDTTGSTGRAVNRQKCPDVLDVPKKPDQQKTGKWAEEEPGTPVGIGWLSSAGLPHQTIGRGKGKRMACTGHVSG